MNKFTDIISAWVTSINPSNPQQNLAQERYNICQSCPMLKENLNIEFCGECGCPIHKKIFSKIEDNSCPLNKWEEVDNKYKEIT